MISVRPFTYREQSGFRISGKDALGRSISVFTLTRSSADHIARKVKDLQHIEGPDFEEQT